MKDLSLGYIHVLLTILWIFIQDSITLFAFMAKRQGRIVSSLRMTYVGVFHVEGTGQNYRYYGVNLG